MSKGKKNFSRDLRGLCGGLVEDADGSYRELFYPVEAYANLWELRKEMERNIADSDTRVEDLPSTGEDLEAVMKQLVDLKRRILDHFAPRPRDSNPKDNNHFPITIDHDAKSKIEKALNDVEAGQYDRSCQSIPKSSRASPRWCGIGRPLCLTIPNLCATVRLNAPNASAGKTPRTDEPITRPNPSFGCLHKKITRLGDGQTAAGASNLIMYQMKMLVPAFVEYIFATQNRKLPKAHETPQTHQLPPKRVHKSTPFRFPNSHLAAAAVAMVVTHFAAPSEFALTYYWDNNGSTAGFGPPPEPGPPPPLAMPLKAGARTRRVPPSPSTSPGGILRFSTVGNVGAGSSNLRAPSDLFL